MKILYIYLLSLVAPAVILLTEVSCEHKPAESISSQKQIDGTVRGWYKLVSDVAVNEFAWVVVDFDGHELDAKIDPALLATSKAALNNLKKGDEVLIVWVPAGSRYHHGVDNYMTDYRGARLK